MYERSKRKRGDHILMDSFWLCVRCVQKKEKEKEKTEAGRRGRLGFLLYLNDLAL